MHGVLGRLPCDLQALVAERVRHEEHLHARLLLSSATRCIAGAATATDARNNVERAMAPWSAILDLGYFDDKIVRLSRIRQAPCSRSGVDKMKNNPESRAVNCLKDQTPAVRKTWQKQNVIIFFYLLPLKKTEI